MKNLLGAGTLLILAACSYTVPVVIISPSGHILRGSRTAAMSGGSFTVAEGTLTCSGNYDAWDMSVTTRMQVLCSDGRKGSVVGHP